MSQKSTQTPIINTLDEIELEERKRVIAHQIWEEEGRPEGQAEQHWEKACLVVMTIAEQPKADAPKWLKPKAEMVAAIESAELPNSINATTTSMSEIRKHPAHRSAA